MGEHTGRRVVNVLLRFFQLCSAVIVVGIIGWALHRIHDGNGSANGRLVYTEVVAALSIVASIVLMPPLRYVFKAWFVDLILFIMWLVAFAVLVDVTDSNACGSRWYFNYWGFFWSRLYITDGQVTSNACRSWRTALAFSGISWILFLLSTILAVIVLATDDERGDEGSHERFHGHTINKPWKRKAGVRTSSENGMTENKHEAQMQSV